MEQSLMQEYFRDESKYDWFLQGIKEGFPLCCILFFMFEWGAIKNKIPEYSKNMDGFIRCPDCIGKGVLQ